VRKSTLVTSSRYSLAQAGSARSQRDAKSPTMSVSVGHWLCLSWLSRRHEQARDSRFITPVVAVAVIGMPPPLCIVFSRPNRFPQLKIPG